MKSIFLFLVFLVTSNDAKVYFCTDANCQMDWTPYPNMGAGLIGYDPAISNPFAKFGDPGMKNQIFAPTQKDEETTRVFTPGYINAEEDLRCTGKMSTSVIRSYGEYRDSRTSNVAMEKSEHSSTNLQTPGWFSMNYDNQETSENSENNDETKIKNLFEESKGEIYLSQITCQTFTMKINEFSKVAFTDGFISALRSLHYGSSLPDDNLEADSIFRTFVKQYGTHYVEEVQMGAQLTIETRYASRTNSITETTERLKCIANAASSETSVGAETQDVDVEVSGGAKGVSATASTTIKGLKAGYTSGHASKDQNCGGMEDDSAYFAENSMQDALIHSVGSLPTQNIDDWTSNEFVPVPIKVKVRGMEEIIRPKWEIWHPNSGGNLGQIPFDPEDPVGGGNLNSTRIQSFFIKKMHSYCKLVLKWKDCSRWDPTIGCGLSSGCPQNTRCEIDKTEPSGEKCVPCGCNVPGSILPPGRSCIYSEGVWCGDHFASSCEACGGTQSGFNQNECGGDCEWHATNVCRKKLTKEQQRWTLQPELRRMIYNSRRWKEPKLNHEKAQARCKKLDSRASLLTLRSKFDEEKFIDSDISNYATEYKAGDYWLGGYFDKDNKTWMWMDDSEVHFDIWDKKAPKFNDAIKKDCLASNWKFKPCDAPNDFYCYFEGSWDVISGKRIYNSYQNGKEQLNYHDAQAKCKRLNKKANLMSIHSKEEEDKLRKSVTVTAPGVKYSEEDANFWIGGLLQEKTKWTSDGNDNLDAKYMIQYSLSTVLEWSWLDGSNWNYSYWGNGQPNGGEDDICVQKRNAHYGLQWNDVDCSNLAYFLCAYDQNLYRPELEEGGRCICKDYMKGEKCDKCGEDTFGEFPSCEPCGCNITGSVLEYDEQKQNLIAKCKDNGQCTCLPGKNIDGDKCDRCREGFTNFPECDKCAEANKWGENCHDICDCDPIGTIASELQSCNRETGQCSCKPLEKGYGSMYEGKNCDRIKKGHNGYKDFCKDKMGPEMYVNAKFQGGTKVFHTGGCDTGEGNCNSDDECKQPRRKCGIAGQGIEEFMPADTRVCQDVRGQCDDWTAATGECCGSEKANNGIGYLCGEDEGDCNSHYDCYGQLLCGKDNCKGNECSGSNTNYGLSCSDCCVEPRNYNGPTNWVEEGFGFLNDAGEAVVGVIKEIPVVGEVVGGVADFASDAVDTVVSGVSDFFSGSWW